MSLNTLKEILNPSTSNLESLYLNLDYSPNLEDYLDFLSPGFTHLRYLNLGLAGMVTFGELVAFRHIHRILSKPGIALELVFRVNRIKLLDESIREDFQALEGRISTTRVLKIVENKYGI